MSKKSKARKAKLSLIKEIEKHFIKLEDSISNNSFELGLYHTKEIEKDFLIQLEKRLEILNEPSDILLEFKERLDKLKKKLETFEF